MSDKERFYCRLFHEAVKANEADGNINPHDVLRLALASLDCNTETFNDLYQSYLRSLG